MRDPLRDAVARAGSKVARCKMNMMLAVRELEAAQKAVMDAPEESAREVVYTVQIMSTGKNRIGVIKAIRELTHLGLYESKNMTDGVDLGKPAVVLDKVPSGNAAHARHKLEQAGAVVKLSKHYV